MDLYRRLRDYRLYQAQIDKLHAKHAHTQGFFELKQEGVPFSAMSFHRAKLARLLAAAVARGRYKLLPARTLLVTVNNKQRLLYEFRLTDRIVHGAISSILTDGMRPHLSPHLYSYIKGTNWSHAVSALSRYVRAHRKSHPDLKTRGLYILRRDIHKYTDRIPLVERSRLWPLLRKVLSGDDPRKSVPADYWSLVQKVVRTEVCFEDGGLATNIRGVPTGSPIATVAFNLYLTPMDHELSAVPGAFYGRYCDDFLFAHTDPEVVRWASTRIDEILSDLELRTNKTKDRDLYFNGAGKGSSEWRETQGAVAIPFLGCRIAFDATVSLGPKKVRQLLKDLTSRARRTLGVLNTRDPEAVGPKICAAINAALNPNAPFHQKSVPFLRFVVTDRSQLRQLDYYIARIVLRVTTRDATVKAFRRIPYRRIRRDWNLMSLYHARNRKRKVGK